MIYGAGGSIGQAVARAFVRERAEVFLAGRTQAKLDAVADDIRAGRRSTGARNYGGGAWSASHLTALAVRCGPIITPPR